MPSLSTAWVQYGVPTHYYLIVLRSAKGCSDGGSETGEELHGPEGFRALQARMLEALPDIHSTVHDCFGAGDRVVARWSATMHHRGTGLGMAATGSEVDITGTGMVRMENGKVTEVWDNWDKFAMVQQIESAVRAKHASA
jgi:predicted ester cyclase